MNSGKTCLYQIWDDADRLLYVGISNQPERRLQEHRNTKPWMEYATKFTYRWIDDRKEAEMEEMLTITSCRPAFNVTWNEENIDVNIVLGKFDSQSLRPIAEATKCLSHGKSLIVFQFRHPEYGFVQCPYSRRINFQQFRLQIDPIKEEWRKNSCKGNHLSYACNLDFREEMLRNWQLRLSFDFDNNRLLFEDRSKTIF
jgi:hypothetical protein